MEAQELREILQKVVGNIEAVEELAYERDWRRSLELVRELEQRLGITVYLGELAEEKYPALVVFDAHKSTKYFGTPAVIARLFIDENSDIEIRKDGGNIEIYPRRYLNLLKESTGGR